MEEVLLRVLWMSDYLNLPLQNVGIVPASGV